VSKTTTQEERRTSFSTYYRKSEEPLIDRLRILGEETGVNTSRLVMASVAACIDQLEKCVPEKRTFKLNNKTVRP